MYDFETNVFEYILGYSAAEWKDLNGGDYNGKKTQS